MTLADARKAYEELSGKASDIVRQLAFGGIALIWLFRLGTDKVFTLDQTMLNAALFIFLALFFDFLQYLCSALIWFLYFRHKEKKDTSASPDFEAPEQLNWPGWTFFCAKAVMILIAYLGFIIPFLFRKFAA
jgi:hypothetical protein